MHLKKLSRSLRSRMLLSLSVVVLTLLVSEFVLKLFFPFNMATIGHRESPNAKKYGWGFAPGETIRIRDPDNTGNVYRGQINSRGWRDKERTLTNHTEAYRILVLGDSNTFGAIVPDDKIYTRILEEKLKQDGLNVEIISIGYGGWGTDQELEALRNEGLEYQPNLIILQFTTNDLYDNLRHESKNPKTKSMVPFYYKSGSNGQLERCKNPAYGKRLGWKERSLQLINYSELGKRILWLAIGYQTKGRLVEQHGPYVSIGSPIYMSNHILISQLRLVLDLPSDDPLLQFLETQDGKKIDPAILQQTIRSSGHLENEEKILRILEKHWFKELWGEQAYYVQPQDCGSRQWELYTLLVLEVKKLAATIGADLKIFCSTDSAKFDWATYWYRRSPEETNRKNYLSHWRCLEDFTRQNNIGLIKNIHPHHRARNDPHPNIAGNVAMAKNIYEYLMEQDLIDPTVYTRISDGDSSN